MIGMKNHDINKGPANHWCRIVMEAATEKIIAGLDYKNFETLEISGDKWINFGFKSCQSLAYPKYDICNNILEEKFDLIIAEQVFEHLHYPYRAAKNVYNMLNDDGYFLLTTPFLIKYHPMPDDCTRWTETGIKYLLIEAGFEMENISAGSWGNKKCLIENLDQWVEYNQEIHSLMNEKDYPIVVWAIAKK